jgi:hypothetical protein
LGRPGQLRASALRVRPGPLVSQKTTLPLSRRLRCSASSSAGHCLPKLWPSLPRDAKSAPPQAPPSPPQAPAAAAVAPVFGPPLSRSARPSRLAVYAASISKPTCRCPDLLDPSRTEPSRHRYRSASHLDPTAHLRVSQGQELRGDKRGGCGTDGSISKIPKLRPATAPSPAAAALPCNFQVSEPRTMTSGKRRLPSDAPICCDELEDDFQPATGLGPKKKLSREHRWVDPQTDRHNFSVCGPTQTGPVLSCQAAKHTKHFQQGDSFGPILCDQPIHALNLDPTRVLLVRSDKNWPI